MPLGVYVLDLIEFLGEGRGVFTPSGCLSFQGSPTMFYLQDLSKENMLLHDWFQPFDPLIA